MKFKVTAAEFTESEAKIAITRGGTAPVHTITLDSETGLAFRRWLKHIGKEAAMPEPTATPEPIAPPSAAEPTAEVPK